MSRMSRTDGPPERKSRLRDRLRQRRQAKKQRKAERALLGRENPVPRTTPGGVG
jgi:hypothetical protein